MRPDVAALAPGAVAFAAFTFLALKDGGYAATTWYPVGLYLLALLAAVVVFIRGDWVRLSRAQLTAIGCFAGYAIWSLLSISWAEVKGDAWDGANRTLLYLVVFTLFALLPWRDGSLLTLLGIYVFATAAVGVVVLVHVGEVANPQPFFIGTRLSSPTGYQNATAALFMAPVWPALMLGSRREVAPIIRGLMLAAAGLLVDLAVLAQSRGWLYAVPVVAILYLVLVPRRIRSILAICSICGATAIIWSRFANVYDARGAHGLHLAMHATWRPISLSCLALFATGIAWSAFDRRVQLPYRIERSAGRVLVALTTVAVLVLVAGFLALNGSGRVSRSWHQFTTETPTPNSGSHFSSGLGGGRYDYWRVALHEFEENPTRGIGIDNFALEYVRLRRVAEEPKYPHSVELRILTGTGSVGAILFLGFLIAALTAVSSAWKRGGRDSLIRAAVMGAVVTFAYWWIHGSVDWFWEFPALAAPAFALLGAAGGVAFPASDSAINVRWRRLGVTAAFVLASFCAVSFVPPWLAARDVAVASSTWKNDPRSALDRLAQARRLNFLSDEPDLVAGAIASREGDLGAVRTSFRGALERNENSWYPYLELGVLAALEGHKAAALGLLLRVEELNPLEPTADLAIRRMRAGRPLTFRQLDRIFVNRVRHRLS
jgi:O-antigen ligase